MSTQTQGYIPELTLGWRLKMALGDIPVQKMAEDLGVSRATVGRWMADKGASPRRAYLLQWAMITRVDPNWLITGINEPQGPDDDGVRRQGFEPRTQWLSDWTPRVLRLSRAA